MFLALYSISPSQSFSLVRFSLRIPRPELSPQTHHSFFHQNLRAPVVCSELRMQVPAPRKPELCLLCVYNRFLKVLEHVLIELCGFGAGEDIIRGNPRSLREKREVTESLFTLLLPLAQKGKFPQGSRLLGVQ
jgi:hypothetical protein